MIVVRARTNSEPRTSEQSFRQEVRDCLMSLPIGDETGGAVARCRRASAVKFIELMSYLYFVAKQFQASPGQAETAILHPGFVRLTAVSGPNLGREDGETMVFPVSRTGRDSFELDLSVIVDQVLRSSAIRESVGPSQPVIVCRGDLVTADQYREWRVTERSELWELALLPSGTLSQIEPYVPGESGIYGGWRLDLLPDQVETAYRMVLLAELASSSIFLSHYGHRLLVSLPGITNELQYFWTYGLFGPEVEPFQAFEAQTAMELGCIALCRTGLQTIGLLGESWRAFRTEFAFYHDCQRLMADPNAVPSKRFPSMPLDELSVARSIGDDGEFLPGGTWYAGSDD